MAERTGVTESERSGGEGRSGGSPAKPGPWLKKHKGLAIAGALGGAVLLMSHKGSQSGQDTGNTQQADQLQQEADTLAAEEAAAGGIYGAGGGGSSDSDDSSNGSTMTPQPIDVGPFRIGGGKGGKGGKSSSGGKSHPGKGGTGNKHHHGRPDHQVSTGSKGLSDSGSDRGHRHPGRDHDGDRDKADKHHPHEAANPHSNHSGGSGTTVHGRTFPGAKGHHVGPDEREGSHVTNKVSVHYGGHTDTHTSVNKGQSWRDHTGGPPSRRTAAQHTAPRRRAVRR